MREDEQIIYHVDEDNRKVVAVLCLDRETVVNEMCRILNKSCWSNFSIVADIYPEKNMLIKGQYRGIATCHKNDVFNVEEGKRIARLKAIKAYMNEKKKLTERILKVFQEVEERMNDMHIHSIKAIENITKDLNDSMN